MANQERRVAEHKSGGVCSAHDIEIFRAWKKAVPGYDWNRAAVDRHEGLTLFDDRDTYTVSLHFPNANCGYGGEGPHATITILEEAGFTPIDEIRTAVFTKMSAEFTR